METKKLPEVGAAGVYGRLVAITTVQNNGLSYIIQAMEGLYQTGQIILAQNQAAIAESIRLAKQGWENERPDPLEANLFCRETEGDFFFSGHSNVYQNRTAIADLVNAVARSGKNNFRFELWVKIENP